MNTSEKSVHETTLIDYVVDTLREKPELAIFLTLSLGYLLGKIRISSFELGSVKGVFTGRHPAEVPEPYDCLFHAGRSVSGFDPVGGNSARLLPDSNATIDAMVADIEAAEHQLFYIWLTDNDGCKMVEALQRAAGRGVKCRAIVDAGAGGRNRASACL